MIIRRTSTRGLTLVELLVTISLIGLLMSVIGVAVFHHYKQGQLKIATIACAKMREAAQRWFIANGDDAECPTPTTMRASRDLDSSVSIDDPWGTPYRITCSPEEIVASSAGPDRAFGSEDDIHVPLARRAPPVATTP